MKSTASQESIVVEGASEVVQTQTAAVSTTLNTNAITSLPMTTRYTLDFIKLLPGVQMPQGADVRSSPINGLPQSSIDITLDDVNVQDNRNKTTSAGVFASARAWMPSKKSPSRRSRKATTSARKTASTIS